MIDRVLFFFNNLMILYFSCILLICRFCCFDVNGVIWKIFFVKFFDKNILMLMFGVIVRYKGIN